MLLLFIFIQAKYKQTAEYIARFTVNAETELEGDRSNQIRSDQITSLNEGNKFQITLRIDQKKDETSLYITCSSTPMLLGLLSM